MRSYREVLLRDSMKSNNAAADQVRADFDNKMMNGRTPDPPGTPDLNF